jgi:type IV pilus assembly protein PilM
MLPALPWRGRAAFMRPGPCFESAGDKYLSGIMLRKREIQPIGVDIGRHSVKMLQLERLGNSLRLRSYARQAIPPEERDGEDASPLLASLQIVRRLLRSGGFLGRSVVVALPRQFIQVKNIRMPFFPPEDFDSALAKEAATAFVDETEEMQFEHLACGEVRQGTEVAQELVVMAARRADVGEFLGWMDRAGGLVVSLDAEPCALYRSVERFLGPTDDEQEVHVLVDLGWDRTQVVIGRGGELNFSKSIDIGALHLNQAVAEKLGITVEEAAALRRRVAETTSDAQVAAVVPVPTTDVGNERNREAVRQAVFNAARPPLEQLGSEVSMCMRYYSVTFRGRKPLRLRLAGGQSTDPQIRNALNAALTVSIQPAQPLTGVDCSAMKPADRRGPLSEWSIALGLALKQIPRGSLGVEETPVVLPGLIGRSDSLHPALCGPKDETIDEDEMPDP